MNNFQWKSAVGRQWSAAHNLSDFKLRHDSLPEAVDQANECADLDAAAAEVVHHVLGIPGGGVGALLEACSMTSHLLCWPSPIRSSPSLLEPSGSVMPISLIIWRCSGGSGLSRVTSYCLILMKRGCVMR